VVEVPRLPEGALHPSPGPGGDGGLLLRTSGLAGLIEADAAVAGDGVELRGVAVVRELAAAIQGIRVVYGRL
jgi:hypothetical protein